MTWRVGSIDAGRDSVWASDFWLRKLALGDPGSVVGLRFASGSGTCAICSADRAVAAFAFGNKGFGV